MWRGRRPRIANIMLQEGNKIGGLTLSNFRTYYKATIIKTVWLAKERRDSSINRTEYRGQKQTYINIVK